MPADITLVNLNMLFMRYGEEVERELHVPLGPLYLTRALEDAGFEVDFRDYQCVASDRPFDVEVFLDFLRDPAPVIGLSCMANLLPFTVLAIRAILDLQWVPWMLLNLPALLLIGRMAYECASAMAAIGDMIQKAKRAAPQAETKPGAAEGPQRERPADEPPLKTALTEVAR